MSCMSDGVVVSVELYFICSLILWFDDSPIHNVVHRCFLLFDQVRYVLWVLELLN